MPNKQIVTTEHERAIAYFCAANNLEFNVATAYTLVVETFKGHPIKQKFFSEDTGKVSTKNITLKVARTIECNPRTIERIAAKIEYATEELNKRKFNTNIQNALNDSCPDLCKLVDNLYQLNIVDASSYLALICFLMQLKYLRNNKFINNDKTCVFFTGVARDGKTATAKAISDIESQYGIVFKPQSGDILESTHEERVWKSHLNVFDEVKPGDVKRELLLTCVNGGEVEINPKNKPQYVFDTNTNLIFTSNGIVPFCQRRISVVKFGDRIDDDPLEPDVMPKIIKNIFDSLPDMKQYNALYRIVSKYNENRLTELAIQDILTYLGKRIGNIIPKKDNILEGGVTFSAHMIYNCIKDTYGKQILQSERKAAIRGALKKLEHEGYITQVKYPPCTTTFYKMTYKKYSEFLEQVSLSNTGYEKNNKIAKNALHDVLAPFFPICKPENAENIPQEINKGDSDEND